MFCPYCGTLLDDDALTCNACNAQVKALEKTPEPERKEAIASKLRSPFARILLTASIIAVALTAVVTLAIHLLPILAGKGPATGLYIKANNLYTTRLSKLQPWQVTEKCIDTPNSAEQIASVGRIDDYTYLTRDGRTLFYPDNFTPGDRGVTIYYRNIKNLEEDPTKLDSDICQYTVSPDGSRVIYLKSDGTLFRYNMQERTQIATGIATDSPTPHFYTSEDCKNLIYMTANKYNAYTVYAQTEGGERLRLARDCHNIQYINNACTLLYYTNRNNILYKVTADQEKERITYDADQVLCVYESGELYYTTKDSGNVPTITPGQFVEDDVKTDASRDPIRQALASATPLNIQYASTLCYYDGTESHTLAENCIFDANMLNQPTLPCATAADTPTLIYSCFEISNVKRVKLSQVTNTAELAEAITKNIANAYQIFVVTKDTVTQMESEHTISAGSIRITNDGKTAYYLLQEHPADWNGELYKFAIADGKIQKAELYASDVCRYTFLDNQTIAYYCNYAQDTAATKLYVNQTLVDSNTIPNTFTYDADNKCLFYFTDMDTNRTSGTLKLWKNGEITKIAEKVYTFEVFDDDVLYITNYDTAKGYGTLYLFQNNASQAVDTNVSHILESNDDFGFVFRKTVSNY